MNKKGFTLTELLVVIAIIAILSVIIIPSIITINNNINERLKNRKIDYIISAAELYGSNHEEIFNGTNAVEVFVYELIESNYLTVDKKAGEGNCIGDNQGNTQKGCMIDPTDDSSMNNLKVILRKETIGIVGTFANSSSSGSETDSSKSLVDTICDGFSNGTFVGQTMSNSGNVVSCNCSQDYKKLVTTDGIEVDACLISGDNVNNYLKYGSASPNWRVLGLYKVNDIIYPKMITSEPIP